MHLKHVRLCRAPILATRITILFLAVFLYAAASGTAQVSITISEKKASVEKCINMIASQSGYALVYQEKLLENLPPLDIEIKGASLEQALEICFRNLPVTYTIYEKTISIKAREIVSFNIIGKVVNEKGEPLAGATVGIKGTKRNIQTDSAGEFMLTGVPENALLVISNVGFDTQIIKPGVNTHIIARLIIAAGKLDEVQVIAYGTVTKRLNTGDVSTVKGEVLEQQPVTNPLEALEGRASGLVITQSSGLPGGFVNVQIRGQNSLRNQLQDNGNYPLYIIDGIPFTADALNSRYQVGGLGPVSPMNSINPNDIESIEILKDADATAIYGSRGANGVILITTKKGKPGKTALTLNCYTGAGKVTRMMNLLNTSQYLAMRREAYKNDGETPGTADAPDLLLWDTTRYTNWQKTIFGNTSHSYDEQLNLSGGSQATQFLIGGSFHRESTVFGGDFLYQKASVHFNISHQSADKKLNIVFSGSYVSDNNNLPYQQMVLATVTTPPDAPPIYDSTGKFNFENGYNNIFNTLGDTYIAKTDNLISNLNLSYLLGAGFSLKVNMGYNSLSLDETQLLPAGVKNPAYSPQTASLFSNNQTKCWIAEPQVSWDKTTRKSKLSVLIGSTLQQTTRNGRALEGTGFSSDALIRSLGAASTVSSLDDYNSDYKYEAVFARVNYNIRDIYIFDLTARRDGSSRFGPGKQFANFGAAAVSWIFTKEKWMAQNVSLLSFGKLRGSYGITGSDQIPDYGFLSTYYAISYYPYQGSGVLQPSRLYNPNFSWETNKKLEFALELGFFKNRLMLTGAWYRNRSGDQLVGYALPVVTGFGSIESNLPATVQNSGLEAELNSTNIHSKNFTWATSINLTLPRNKLLSYPGIASSSYSEVYQVGAPLSIQYLFHGAGVDPATGLYQFADAQHGGTTLNPAYPDDLQTKKKIAVTAYGGLSNSLHFKNWQLNFLWQFVQQTGRNYQYNLVFDAPGMASNQPVQVLQRWQKAGDIKPFEQFTQDFGSLAFNSYLNAAYYGDNTIVDASFIRLKNISLSYDIPRAAIKGFSARVFVRGQNMVTITRFITFDPENQGTFNLPPLKTIAAGFQLSF